MTDHKTDKQSKKDEMICSFCRTRLNEKEAYAFRKNILCETCCMTIRMPRIRKTHWQYLTSIKQDYLRPAKTENWNSVKQIESGD